LIEGVADQDWGIASAMAMVVATAKGCDGSLVYKIMSSLIHFFSYRFHTVSGVDRRDPQDPRILYLGSVRINIPKIKYSVNIYLSFVHTFL